MHRVAPFAFLMLLAACSQKADQPAPSEAPAAAQSTSGVPVEAVSPGATIPPLRDIPRYLGRWAAREDLCQGGAWTFTRDGAGLEDGPTCHFDSVNEIPGGYHVTATCEHDGKTRREMATLRFAESAKAMLVENLATLPDTGLVYCGPPPQALEGETK